MAFNFIFQEWTFKCWCFIVVVTLARLTAWSPKGPESFTVTRMESQWHSCFRSDESALTARSLCCVCSGGPRRAGTAVCRRLTQHGRRPRRHRALRLLHNLIRPTVCFSQARQQLGPLWEPNPALVISQFSGPVSPQLHTPAGTSAFPSFLPAAAWAGPLAVGAASPSGDLERSRTLFWKIRKEIRKWDFLFFTFADHFYS